MLDIFRGKRVFLTGHTGFKGAWLTLWLNRLGASVTGYSLRPAASPNMFDACELAGVCDSRIQDIRDFTSLENAMHDADSEIVIHMAAQALVRQSYRQPRETFDTNVMGTVNVLEACRRLGRLKAVLIITSDKCYENREWLWGYRESDPLGGRDPYSASKGATEIVTNSYMMSFFNPLDYAKHGVGVATARAGNVIGGGDWSEDRLLPDCVRAAVARQPVTLRFPESVRPWQHVLEPLYAYLRLIERLYTEGDKNSGAWNFGPGDDSSVKVKDVVRMFIGSWGDGASFKIDSESHPHEAYSLRLDCSKSRALLGVRPVWSVEKAVPETVRWYKAYYNGDNVRDLAVAQIDEYHRTMLEEA